MSALTNSYPNREKTFVKGEGCYLYDERGGEYLDFMTNYGVNIFGHNHPALTAALEDQLRKLTVLHGSFTSDIRDQAAEELVRRCGGKLEHVYFSNSGAEAVEAALKFAVLATGKKGFVAMEGAYHGKTLGALSVTHSPKYRKDFEPLPLKTSFVPFGNIQSLENAIEADTAAIIMEPIQGESGVILPPEGYLRAVSNLCGKRGVLLIFDEIQTGLGRTGTFLAAHRENIQPDIVCLGKGLGGGIPLAATLVSDEVSSSIGKSVHTSTMGGNPLACRGLLETLKLLNDETLEYVQKSGQAILEGLKNLNADGTGLMIGIDAGPRRSEILKTFQDKRLLAAPAGVTIVRFLPPYIIGEKEIKQVLSICADSF